ncbi:hypothetical protein, conserved [Angomonas deanei]|uniref:Uncharacterized protein n=1 Tax=Angomonas deanei TaxID=59799 RepID=A0A7G2CNQ5_9TRYP|nr:hypothetical protein, conserved [Angomonas deanei]
MTQTSEEYTLLALVLQQFGVEGKSLSYLAPRVLNKVIRGHLTPRHRFANDHHDTCMYIARSKNKNVVAYTANLLIPPASEKKENENEETIDVELHEVARCTPTDTGAHKNAILNSADPIHAYFINLEPSYIEARRKKGILHDCDDLNFIERTMAYGCSATPLTVVQTFQLQYTLFPTHPEKETLFFQDATTQLFWKELSERSAAVKSVVEEDAKAGTHDWKNKNFIMASVHAHDLFEICGPLDVAGFVTVSSSTRKNNNNENNETNADFFSPTDTVPVIITTIMGEISLLDHVFVASIEPKHFYQLPSVEYIEAFGVCLVTGAETYEKKTQK